jgi:hypothetical protein
MACEAVCRLFFCGAKRAVDPGGFGRSLISQWKRTSSVSHRQRSMRTGSEPIALLKLRYNRLSSHKDDLHSHLNAGGGPLLLRHGSFLLLAGLFEIGWAVRLKLTQNRFRMALFE